MDRGLVPVERGPQPGVEQRGGDSAGEELLVLLVEGDGRGREAAPEARHVGREPAAHRLLHAAAPDLDRAGHRDLAQLLGEALDQSAHERQVVVDPDERHPPDRLAARRAVQDDVGLLVLTPGGVVAHARVGVGRRAPVREHEAAGAVTRGFDLGRQQRSDRAGVRGEVDRDDLARVVPGRRREDRRPAGVGLGQRPALQGHLVSDPVSDSSTPGSSNHTCTCPVPTEFSYSESCTPGARQSAPPSAPTGTR